MVLDSQQLTNVQGESLTVEQALANLRQTEDPSLRYYAAWWIGRFRVNLPAAIDALVDCLADETDRAPDGGYPPAAVTLLVPWASSAKPALSRR